MATLSYERIVEAGLDLIDQLGPQGLTMRALADELGVTATALDYYCDGRDALLEGIVDHVAAGIVAAAPSDGNWQSQIRSLLVTMVEHTSAHPATIGWVITEYAKRPPVIRIHERILSIFHTAGFTPEEAVTVKGILLRFCTGHLILSVSAPELDWREVPKGAYDNYRIARKNVKQIDKVDLFRMGLDIMITGAADRFPAQKRRGRRTGD